MTGLLSPGGISASGLTEGIAVESLGQNVGKIEDGSRRLRLWGAHGTNAGQGYSSMGTRAHRLQGGKALVGRFSSFPRKFVSPPVYSCVGPLTASDQISHAIC